MARLEIILLGAAIFIFAFAGVFAGMGYSGNEAIATHYMTEGEWSDSSCGGCHFTAPDHVATNTHIQRDIGEWDPLTNFNIEAEGEDEWVKKFGAYHPGGGELEAYGVDADCMICHEQYGEYDFDARAELFAAGDFETANAAAMEAANVKVQQDTIRKITYVGNAVTPLPLLLLFHDSVNGAPVKESCSDNCHVTNVETTAVTWASEDYHKFDAHADVNCVECHEISQSSMFVKQDLENIHEVEAETKSCDDPGCHEGISHGPIVDAHETVACESCHIPALPGGDLGGVTPLASFDWSNGGRVDSYKDDSFEPVLAWSNGIEGHELPATDGRGEDGVLLEPFNVVTGIWWDAGINSEIVSSPDTSNEVGDAIPVSDVKAADSNDNGVVTADEMRSFDGDIDGNADYPNAVLRTVELYYKLSHNIASSEVGLADPLACADCHGSTADAIDWESIGFISDPAETDPPTDFTLKDIGVTIPGAKPPEVEREPAF
ncbi:MAG: methanogenesis multiheme c-type cytochrome [Methanococcoides sp.]|nr:methanogenesis multiheme c-type cytochrome [Methanococcoides sp.]